MGEMASLWDYEENQDMDQLGQKLLFTTLELEKLKSETMEEMQKTKDYVNQLVVVLKCAIQERDEARNQLEKLINKSISITKPPDTFPHFHRAMANSSVTESNILSETYNYCSPPVESLFNPPVASPNMLIHQESNGFSSKIDEGSLIMDSLVGGRVLPQKGKFLKTVVEAGPLLQTLLVGGPLPRWRNQPQMQAFQIPPLSIRGGGDVEHLGQKPTSSSVYANFGGVKNGSLMNSGASNNDCFGLGKRQRFC